MPKRHVSGETIAVVQEKEESGFFAAYAEFAKTLRTWFVAYGIGAPVVLMTQQRLMDALVASGQARFIAALFLTGVAVQVLEALLYKVCMWCCYAAELEPRRKQRTPYRVSDWISNQLWLELVFDAVTIWAFGLGTTKLVLIVIGVRAGVAC